MLTNKPLNKFSPSTRLINTRKKLIKLRKNPKLFLIDSQAYLKTKRTLYYTYAKLGSFALVLIATAFLLSYYLFIASPRYVSQFQFVVKQASNNELPLAGLAALGASSPSTRDALILQEYIQSPEMADALDKTLDLKSHYESDNWDVVSRLNAESTNEEFYEYFKSRILVTYDEMSEILKIEVQGYEAEYALKIATAITKISEQFINKLGEKMAQQQLQYAQNDVTRAYGLLKEQQVKLVEFQDKFKLFNPEIQSEALLKAINSLEGELIKSKTELKAFQAYMQPNAAQIKAEQFKIDALEEQLKQERSRLISQDKESLNKINFDYKEIELNAALAADLYKSSLASLEMARTDALGKLKHLLIIENPRLAQEDAYPRRLYSIITWFVILLIGYSIIRLLIAVIKDHRE